MAEKVEVVEQMEHFFGSILLWQYVPGSPFWLSAATECDKAKPWQILFQS